MGRKKKEKVKTKQELLNEKVAQIAKDLGPKAVMMVGGDDFKEQCKSISTGSLGLDKALAIGGFPKGRITELMGLPGVGKTTLCLNAVANAQKGGGTAAFIDAEHALDPLYCQTLGVDLDKCAISQPEHGEQALTVAEELIKAGVLDILVVDSVAALTPKAEIAGEMGQQHVGVQAKLMNQAMRKLKGIIQQTGTCVLFTNQFRDKIGVQYGSPRVTTGGNALKYYADLRMEVRRVAGLKTGDESVGNRIRVIIGKSKVSKPGRLIEFDLLFGHGINAEGEILDIGVDLGIVEKKGAWFNYGEVRLGQGRGNVCEFLRNNTEIRDEIREKSMSDEGNENTPGSHTEDNKDGEDNLDAEGTEEAEVEGD